MEARQVAKATASDLDMRIRALNPANPVQMAWINRDRHSTMFASVIIPTAEYNLTNEELWCAAASSLGIENPVCLPHIGASLVRKAPEEAWKVRMMMTRGGEGTKSMLLASRSARVYNRVAHGKILATLARVDQMEKPSRHKICKSARLGEKEFAGLFL